MNITLSSLLITGLAANMGSEILWSLMKFRSVEVALRPLNETPGLVSRRRRLDILVSVAQYLSTASDLALLLFISSQIIWTVLALHAAYRMWRQQKRYRPPVYMYLALSGWVVMSGLSVGAQLTSIIIQPDRVLASRTATGQIANLKYSLSNGAFVVTGISVVSAMLALWSNVRRRFAASTGAMGDTVAHFLHVCQRVGGGWLMQTPVLCIFVVSGLQMFSAGEVLPVAVIESAAVVEVLARGWSVFWHHELVQSMDELAFMADPSKRDSVFMSDMNGMPGLSNATIIGSSTRPGSNANRLSRFVKRMSRRFTLTPHRRPSQPEFVVEEPEDPAFPRKANRKSMRMLLKHTFGPKIAGLEREQHQQQQEVVVEADITEPVKAIQPARLSTLYHQPSAPPTTAMQSLPPRSRPSRYISRQRASGFDPSPLFGGYLQPSASNRPSLVVLPEEAVASRDFDATSLYSSEWSGPGYEEGLDFENRLAEVPEEDEDGEDWRNKV
jgi:hypothetical protein